MSKTANVWYGELYPNLVQAYSDGDFSVKVMLTDHSGTPKAQVGREVNVVFTEHQLHELLAAAGRARATRLESETHYKKLSKEWQTEESAKNEFPSLSGDLADTPLPWLNGAS